MASKPKTTQQAPDNAATTPPNAPSKDNADGGVANKPEERPAGAVSHPALKVRASVPRRYRGGIAFGAEPVVIPAGTLTAEQLQAIVNDPCLGVAEVRDGEKTADQDD
ncbi:hypothetical protein AFEL58S_01995 [Afipia felis]